MNIRDMAINGVLAAVYVALTVINPIGTGAIQFRISEMLCVIPFFNRKYITGMILGVGIANIFSSLGLIDVIVGVTISVIAYSLSYFIKNVWVNALQYSVLAGLFVGLALYLVLGLPYWFSAATVGLSTLITTFIGTFIFKKIGHKILPE